MNLSSHIHDTFKESIDDPEKRFKQFFDFYCDVKINPSFSIQIYLRSAREMLRMANIYFSEKDYLAAFMLYSRYAILYIDKIKTHPDYDKINKNELSEIMKEMRRTALPKAEKLKTYIKECFANEAKQHIESSTKNSNNEIINDNNDELIANKYDSIIESKYKLRNLIIPSDISSQFLKMANTNTAKNIETCGIIAGRLEQNVFIGSHCIIPKQSGCSDTCTTEKENEIFDAIDKLNLITIGWIHTHPSQTSFLSSVDLHTHYAYQLMLPEAIAIVVAPKYNETGIYMLNPDYGMKTIGECTLKGFHAHQTSPSLFEDCGHVKLDDSFNITILDIRNI